MKDVPKNFNDNGNDYDETSAESRACLQCLEGQESSQHLLGKPGLGKRHRYDTERGSYYHNPVNRLSSHSELLVNL
jgi:hypothetical protein